MIVSPLTEKKQPVADTLSPRQVPHSALSIQTLRSDLKNIGSSQYRIDASEPEKASANPFRPVSKQEVDRKQDIPKNNLSHPFGVAPLAEKTPPAFSPTQAPVLENGLTSLLPQGELLTNQPAGRHTPAWVLPSIGGIVVVACGIGIWYFFFYTDESLLESNVPGNFVQEIPLTNMNSVPMQGPFSLDKPNYLSLNTETVSSLDIKKILLEKADRIKEAGISVPVEFFVTDQNNNPLAFSRFAFLFDFGLDADILALTEESFSLYAFNDQGQVRFGLALDFKNKDAAAALLAKTEAGLPYALRSLIVESDISAPQKSVFRSAQYGQSAIRFTNIDGDRNISLDYALNNSRLFLGMSKNTLRALLDTYAR